MLTLYVLAIVLMFAAAGFAALGVEDTKFHKSLEPKRYEASPTVVRWDDCLPGKPVLSWATVTEK